SLRKKRSGFSTVTTAPPTAVHNETLREQESKKRRHKIQANPKSLLLTSKSEMLTRKSLLLTSKSEMLTRKSLLLTRKSEMLASNLLFHPDVTPPRKTLLRCRS